MTEATAWTQGLADADEDIPFDAPKSLPALEDEAVLPLDLVELLAGPVPTVEWLWQEWIALQDLVLLVGEWGSGKSLQALFLANQIRHGGDCLGARCAQGNVAILDFENPLPVVHLRLRQLGLTSEDHDGLSYFHFPAVDLRSDEGRAWLERTIINHQLAFIVLDSFRRIAPGLDENDSSAVSAFMTPLRAIIARTGCTILLLHHPKKRQNDAPTEAGQLVRGSGDFVASVDTLLFARKKGPGQFTLESDGKRHGYAHEPILVRISAPDADRLELVNEGAVDRADDKVEGMLARIVDALRADGGALERPQLAVRVGASSKDGTFTRALNLGWQRELLAKTERSEFGGKTIYALAIGEPQIFRDGDPE